MPEGPTNRVVVITGASKGIGREVAVQFAARGDRVVLAARSEASLLEAARSIRDAGGQAWACKLDVTSAEECNRVFDWVERELGRVDICVLNAGVGHWGPAAEMSDEHWAETFRVNVDGAFYCTRAALRTMLRRGRGHLIYLSSIMARKGMPNMAAYAASKAAVAGLAESVALEVKARGIKVSVLYPGTTATTMRDHQTERPPTPATTDPALQLRAADVADAVVWVASAASHAFPTALMLEPPA